MVNRSHRRCHISARPTVIDTLLFAAARISTFELERGLTNASGFFFERDGALFLVTSRHVVIDEPSSHHPNRIEVELHTDATNLGRSATLSIMLFDQGIANWRQANDAGGEVDVAVIEVDRSQLPAGAVFYAFGPEHLVDVSVADARTVPVGSSLLIVGFPLGFHDTLHHLAVVRRAVLASAFGLRFQGLGYFLTDARMHRGTSGAPVVMSKPSSPEGTSSSADDLPWMLLGVHSGRLDMSGRDKVEDERLGLNMAWYADILMTLTQPRPQSPLPSSGVSGRLAAGTPAQAGMPVLKPPSDLHSSGRLAAGTPAQAGMPVLKPPSDLHSSGRLAAGTPAQAGMPVLKPPLAPGSRG